MHPWAWVTDLQELRPSGQSNVIPCKNTSFAAVCSFSRRIIADIWKRQESYEQPSRVTVGKGLLPVSSKIEMRSPASLRSKP
jgi:hypothetical protein